MAEKSNMRRLFIVLFPFACFFVFAYPPVRLANWYSSEFNFTAAGLLGLWLAGLAGMYFSFSGPKMKIRCIVVHWMGAGFIFACLTLAGEAALLFGAADTKTAAEAILAVGSFLVLSALVFSHRITIRKIRICSKKLSRRYRVVQISDVHIGSRQKAFMTRIVKKINSLAPDFVAVTGDLIDSSAMNFDAVESIAELKAEIFFTIGNHERYADLNKILDIADRLGMKTLRQAAMTRGELTFIGIDDADRKDQVDIHLPGIELDKKRFNLLLYHRPAGWEAAIIHGVDLMLSGHTHNGQIFPFNLIVKQQFSRINGLYRHNQRHLYVSPGTGTWGPLMRLGSFNEITLFELVPG